MSATSKAVVSTLLPAPMQLMMGAPTADTEHGNPGTVQPLHALLSEEQLCSRKLIEHVRLSSNSLNPHLHLSAADHSFLRGDLITQIHGHTPLLSRSNQMERIT